MKKRYLGAMVILGLGMLLSGCAKEEVSITVKVPVLAMDTVAEFHYQSCREVPERTRTSDYR